MRVAMLVGLLFVPMLASGQEVSELDEQILERPRDVELRLDRAEALLAVGRFDEAMIDCDVAAQIAPNEPSIALTRGRIHLALGELERAEVFFSKYLEKAQPTIEVYLMRGNIREETRRFEEALADYDAARKLARIAKQQDALHLLQIVEIEKARARALDALGKKREARLAREHADHLESLISARRVPSES